MERPSVALVMEATYPPLSRANVRMLKLCTALVGRGFHTFLLSPAHCSIRARVANASQITVFQHPGFSRSLYSDFARLLVRVLHLFYATVYAIRLARGKSVVAIHAWHPIASLSALVAGKIVRRPVFLDWTDFYSDIARYESPIIAPLFSAIEFILVLGSTRIITVSEEMKQAIVSLGAPDDKVYVVHDGVDTSLFNPATSGAAVRKLLGIGDAPLMIFHGDLKPMDGVDILIVAMKKVLNLIPDAKLLIVGGSGGYFDNLRRMTEENGVSSAITFTGWVPHAEVPKYVAAADIGVMPLRTSLETNCYLSFKIFEYWSMGKPVVVSRLRAISRFAVDNLNALIVNPQDPDDLAEKLCTLLSNRILAQELGAAGRRLVEHSFRWEQLMEHEVDLLYPSHNRVDERRRN